MIWGADPSLDRLQRRHWALVAGCVGLSALTGSPGVGGVLLGGGIIGVSVLVYAAGLGLLLRRTRVRLAIALLSVKLLLLLGLGWWAFTAGASSRPDPVGLALGLTCFPVAAVWEALGGQRRDGRA